MARDIEDVGTTPRKKLTRATRLRVFEAAAGRCYLCDRRINPGDGWIVEHVTPLQLGGADDESNMQPVHRACAQAKTNNEAPIAAKVKRIKQKHLGITRSGGPKLPFGRDSPLKKTISGKVVPRHPGRGSRR